MCRVVVVLFSGGLCSGKGGNNCHNGKGKSNIVSVLNYALCHDSILGSGGVAPGINLGARWKSVVNFMTPPSSSCQNSFHQTTAKNENSTFSNWKWQKKISQLLP